ncbi:hypothetical protein [Rhizobacter sp. Root1221]|uniref:hypothetical protein n=1 Tax=Rhizobacter sp. Root1221 TaxID=1736433 RepID=UPI0006F81201|nr:hypothetical protein [Rhizobacter sp. Root1221]KQW02802.1 hypothetical protein ASC87_00120 [Rhizobacter sp. Root1221]
MTSKGKEQTKAKPTRNRKSVVGRASAATKRERKPRRVDEAPAIASPAAAGPAGPRLEGHVGAQYLLPLLSGGEARGLPGVVITRVAFQRAGLGHPMDDLIVTGHDSQGAPATLELQAKRTIAFTAGDSVFVDVAALACRAAAKPEFETTRYELAVAIARTSTKIEQHVQDVLTWARQYQNPEDFFRRLNQAGTAHQGMRDFVEAFRGHMRTAGALHDDAAVWRLLRRFQVLAFDFEQPGSMCALYARERCAALLAPQEVGRAGQLWDSLQQIALEVDAVGGDLDATALRERIVGGLRYRLTGDRRLHVARDRLAEAAENTLATIGTRVHGVPLDRGNRVAAALSSFEQGRYLEIRGAGGVGKSGVLKDLAQHLGVEARVVVVAPHRIPGGGWAVLQAQLGCDANARELLTDLAGDGGATLFIDGLDRFDDPGQRATVSDLICAAAQVRGFRVVVTARLDFDADARAWLPTLALQELGEAPPLVIDELSDDEVSWLANADPALAALLRPGHPAEKLARNLYRLNRLVRSAAAEGAAPFSEAQMALQWWTSGDAVDATGRLDRRRVLRALAVHSLLASSAPMDSSALSAEAIAALTESGSLRAVSSVRVEPTHDVLRDWAIGCLLYEEPGHFAAFALESPAPMRLVRGVELAARLHAESGNDAAAWRALLDRVSLPGAHGSWRRAVLLALARSERAQEALYRCLPTLAADDAELLSDLVRAAITVDSQPAAPLWAALGADTSKLTDDFVAPRGPAWFNLIAWSLAIGDRLHDGAVPQFVDLYGRWCSAFAGQDALSPLLVARLHAWLVEVEAKNHPKASGFQAWMAAKEAPGLSMTTAQESELRTVFLLWCKLRPADAEAYLRGVAAHPHRHVLFRQLLSFVGTAPYAAPQAVADLFLQALPEGDSEEDDRRSRMRDAFVAWDLEYFPASPARAPFLDLLQANKEQGLRLVHGIVAHAVRRRSRGREPGDSRIEVLLHSGPRSFPWRQSYTWSRAQDSHIVASALMALEAWAHLRIERGEPVQDVIDDVLGPEGYPAAYLLVAVDVMLSHWPKSRECLWPFAASAELLALDRQRIANDKVNGNGIFTAWVHPEPAGAVRLDNLRRRLSRRTALDAVLFEFGLHGPADMREAMRQALRGEAARIGAPDAESRGMADPRFAAMSALNRLDAANYVPAGADEGGQPIIEYVPPADEARLVAEFREKAQRGGAEVAIRGQLMQALTEPCCPAQLLEQGLRWATGDASVSQGADKDEQGWIERTRFTVAALVMRDGSPEVKAAHGEWARAQLTQAVMRESDDRGFAQQLPCNSAAIAAVGFLAAYRDDRAHADLRSLLQLAARRDTGMASVLRAELAARHSLRPELELSLVRLGLASAIYAVPQRDDDDSGSIDDYRARKQALEEARKKAENARLQGAVEEELRWLAGEGREPGWPALPDPNPPKERHAISLGKPRQRPKRRPVPPREFGLDAATAAQWLSLAVELWRAARSELLGALVGHCWHWTAGANGVDCGLDEEPGEIAFEWNDAYFVAALAAALAAGDAGIEEYVLQPLAQLPEERFLNAADAVLHELDRLWLNGGVVSDSTAVSIREALAKRLVATRAWRRLASERSSGIGIHVAGAVAAMFMGRHEMGRGSRCYVLPPGAARVDFLLPMLTPLAEQAAGSAFVGMAFLGLLEVEPHAERLMFMARAVAAWWRVQGANAEFWSDQGIGRRLCDWIDKALLAAPVSPAVLDSAELTSIVDTLLQCGTPLARALEERLADCRKGYCDQSRR